MTSRLPASNAAPTPDAQGPHRGHSNRGRYVVRAWAIIAAGLALDLGLVYAVIAAHQRDEPPMCDGIGWGCNLSPLDSVGLWVMAIAGPAAVGAAALAGFTALARTERLRRVLAYSVAGAAVTAGVAVPLLWMA